MSIILGLESLYLSQFEDGELFLNTRTKIQIEYAAGGNNSSQGSIYSHSGDSRPAEEWFEDNGAPLQSGVALGIEKTVSQMLWALRPLHRVP